jgi:WD40 repeat protein
VLNFHTSQSDAVNSRSLEELQANYQHRADVVDALVRKFKELYLLTDSSPSRNALAHDTLANVVHNEVNHSDRPGQKALRVLVSKMANYQRAPDQTYLDEQDLALVESGKNGMRIWMPEEAALVEKSQARRLKLEAERARNRRFRKYALAAIAVLAVLALGAGYKFLQETKIARIVADARLQAEDNPTVAMQILEKARALAPESHAVLEAYASIYSENEFYETTLPHPAPVKDLVFGPVPDEALYTRTDQMIYKWRRNGALQDSLAVPNVSAFALAPDGKTLVAASVDGSLFILNSANLRQPAAIFPQVNEGAITDFAFSPDGQKLFFIGHQEALKTLKINDLRANPSSSPLTAVPACIAIHPQQGDLLVGYENGIAEARSPDGKTVLHTLKRHTDKVLTFAFSPSGDTLVTAGRDALLCFWGKNGELILPLKAHKRRVNDVIWSKANNRIFSTGTDYRMNIWSPAGDLVAVYKGHTSFANAVAATADGLTLATAGEDRVVRLWKTESKVRYRFGPHQNGVSGLALSRDGKTVLTAADAGRWQNGERMNDSAPTDPATGSDPILDAMLASLFAPPPSLAFVWDTAKSAAPIRTLKGHDGGINTAAIRPDGAEFLTAGDDQRAIAWDANGNKIKELVGGHERWLLGAAYAPDGQRIVTAGHDGQAIVWDNAGKILRKIPHGDIVSCAVFSPDGKYWATGCYDGWVRVFTAAGDSLRAFQAPSKKAIGALAFSPDGESILVGEVNSTQAWLCNLEGAPRYALTVLAENKTGGQSINAVAFSPDGRLACLAAQGGVAQVFRLEEESALPLHTLQHPHRWPILSVCFSSDGKGVLTGGGDGWARWWGL